MAIPTPLVDASSHLPRHRAPQDSAAAMPALPKKAPINSGHARRGRLSGLGVPMGATESKALRDQWWQHGSETWKFWTMWFREFRLKPWILLMFWCFGMVLPTKIGLRLSYQSKNMGALWNLMIEHRDFGCQIQEINICILYYLSIYLAIQF